MDLPDEIDAVSTIVFGIVLLFLPVLFIGFTLAFLQFTEAALLAELSTLELVELYVIELFLFGVTIYALYRLAKRMGGAPK